MTRRWRFVAGLCALLALTFSFAESVWASTCAMPMAMGSGMAEAHEPSPSGIPSDGHCATDRSGDTRPDGPAPQPCPFDSGLAAQACAGVASLPATNGVLPAPGSETVGGAFTLDVQSGLLLEGSLFRPPRA